MPGGVRNSWRYTMAYTPVHHAQKQCPYCDQMFTPDRKNRTRCYTETCRKAHNAAKQRAYVAGHEERTGVSYWAGGAHRGQGRTTYTRACAFCGGAYQTHTRDARYCSATHALWDRWGWSKSREVMLYTKHYTYKPTAAPLNVVRGKGQYIVGQCVVCNTSFITRHVDITCSDECQDERARDIKHSAEQRRRARERKAFVANVNRKQIFKRDGHRCHICKAMTNPKAKVPNPKAPTIDHIIPLAKGGTHEPSNVATACFMCNCLKSDRGTGDQLLLFG